MDENLRHLFYSTAWKARKTVVSLKKRTAVRG